MPSRFICVVANEKIFLFLWLYSVPLCVYVCVFVCVCMRTHARIFFIHFSLLAIVNNVAVNIGMDISFSVRVFVFFKYIIRSGIAGLYYIFNFCENLPCYFLYWLYQFTFQHFLRGYVSLEFDYKF